MSVKNLSILPDVSENIDQTINEHSLAEIGAFCRKLSKCQSLYDEVLRSRQTNGQEPNIWSRYNAVKKRLILEIEGDKNPEFIKTCLQAYLDFVYCEIKFSSVVIVFDSLVKESLTNLLKCLFLSDHKSSSSSFIQLCNQKPDYLTCVLFIMSSAPFLEEVRLLSTTGAQNHLIKCLLKLDIDSALAFCEANSPDIGIKNLQSRIAKLWLCIISLDLADKQVIIVLSKLREKVMPVIADCRDLTDFLMLSLNSSSQKRKFLALECFYDLIVRYNIEYPGLYGQLLDMCSERSFRLSTYSLSFLTILGSL